MPEPFRIIPVLDLRRGVAVHARGGRRETYEEVDGCLGRGRDPVPLAAHLCRAAGSDRIYVADLDAIEGTGNHRAIVAALAALDLAPMLDAGIGDEADLATFDAGPRTTWIAATESLVGAAAIGRMVARLGGDRVAFSLDLRDGRPVLAPGADWPGVDPVDLASLAADAGAARLILLDVARVGGSSGPHSLGLLAAIRRRLPSLPVLVGGGVSGPDDLRRWRDAGADGVLVATALHRGLIGPGVPVEAPPPA